MTYGCFNRAPFVRRYTGQKGYLGYALVRKPNWVSIPNVMSKECQYSKTTDDPRCAGCKEKFDKSKEV